jgi:flavin reductase (DIM6/NTAB) family NADH-FMN oxidoreductase RutF
LKGSRTNPFTGSPERTTKDTMPQLPDRSPFDLRAAAFDQAETRCALSLLPASCFVLTAAHEGRRAGLVALSVQLCASEPQLISVAVRKGHVIEPIIRDSHAFAVCRIAPDDKLTARKFAEGATVEGDAFDSLAIESLVTNAPVIKRCIMALDCEVIRHFDMEADCELYVGRILAGRVYQGEPAGGRMAHHANGNGNGHKNGH